MTHIFLPLAVYGGLDYNSMTRQLGVASFTGPGSYNYWCGDPEGSEQDTLQRAKAALESCSFIGLYDNFERDVRRLSDVLGLADGGERPHVTRGINRRPHQHLAP